MKLYRVVRREGVWHAVGGDPEHAIAASNDRDALILLARRVAARQKGELYVYDEECRLELVYVYTDGIESKRRPSPGSLRIVRSDP